MSALAWIALQSKDRVGGLVLGDNTHMELRPKASRKVVLSFIRYLDTYCQQRKSPIPNGSVQSMDQLLMKLNRVARPGSASGRNSPADAPCAPLASAMAEETPLTRSCAAEGCTRSAQLLRLHVRSPEAAQQLLLRPRVRFLAADNGAASAAAAELFEPDVPLLLPSETALCLRLPLIFNAAGKPLLTAATAADASRARKAVLLPHWLCMAGAADLPADA